MYDLLKENVNFMRIFQFFGCLPLKLTKNEPNFAKVLAFAVPIFVVSFAAFNIFLRYAALNTVILLLMDGCLLVVAPVCAWIDRKSLEKLMIALGEADQSIARDLDLRNDLVKRNVKLNRIFAAVWAVYMALSLYKPLSEALQNDFLLAVRSCRRILIWSLIIHVNKSKFLYFFALILVRLDVIKKCLEDMQLEKRAFVLIRKFSSDSFGANLVQVSKIRALREIYHRLWLLQGLSYQLSGKFMIVYIVCYAGQFISFIYFQIKPWILAGVFVEELGVILLFILLLNVFVVAFFIVSYKIQMRGSQIAGLIHNISDLNDHATNEAVKMFSLQLAQQPMTTINVFGIVNYDRVNLNGVRLRKKTQFLAEAPNFPAFLSLRFSYLRSVANYYCTGWLERTGRSFRCF